MMVRKRQKVSLPGARRGRPSSYKPDYANMAKHAAKLGATDADLAKIFGVSDATIDNWKAQHPEFLGSLGNLQPLWAEHNIRKGASDGQEDRTEV
jgi:transposase-like protein